MTEGAHGVGDWGGDGLCLMGFLKGVRVRCIAAIGDSSGG